MGFLATWGFRLIEPSKQSSSSSMHVFGWVNKNIIILMLLSIPFSLSFSLLAKHMHRGSRTGRLQDSSTASLLIVWTPETMAEMCVMDTATTSSHRYGKMINFKGDCLAPLLAMWLNLSWEVICRLISSHKLHRTLLWWYNCFGFVCWIDFFHRLPSTQIPVLALQVLRASQLSVCANAPVWTKPGCL